MNRVGQNHTFIGITVYIRHFWQGNHHTYGHIRCVYTVLANPKNEAHHATHGLYEQVEYADCTVSLI